MRKLRIIVVDNHSIVREGLTSVIRSASDMMVVAEGESGREAIELFQEHKPDVTLLDARIPNGLKATAEICKCLPKPGLIVVSISDGDEDIYRAVQAGAQSYLCKTVQPCELIAAIRAVSQGRYYLPPDIAARLAQRVHKAPVTSREIEVLELIAQGRTNKEIATALFIAEVTVKLHVSHILAKLQAHDRTHATVTALQRGILHLDGWFPAKSATDGISV